ncbi:MAG: class I SAM-dependent methyltransferase [Sedimenticolaceae bacterium]|nr:class I SAM-dependent methyltransferase [Sedimenticolaceae bacterium]
MTRRLTDVAHDVIAGHVHAGDIVIDATMGNGHDTLFLAQLVGETGHVYALDLQQRAIDQTRARLDMHGAAEQVTLIKGDHAEMGRLLPQGMAESVAAIVFNLGYLPGGVKSVTTTAESTLYALDASRELIKPGGIISLLVYVGHPGGLEEDVAIREWLGSLPEETQWVHHNPDCAVHSPRLYTIIKGAESLS